MTASAAPRVGIAVITDGPQFQLEEVEQIFVDELLALTNGEFDVEFKKLIADWSIQSVNSAIQAAYADPSVDMVLVLGFAANQLLVSRDRFPKPTFLPLVLNPDLLDAPRDTVGSGKRNLSYLADSVPFSEDLQSFRRVVPFSKVVLMTDAVIIESIPRAPSLVRDQGKDIEFTFVGHNGADHALLEKIPAGTDAILLGGLPRLPPDLFDELLVDLAQRGLPTFSLVSEREVIRGALAADVTRTDYQRTARRNALHMQAVLLGDKAENLSVSYDGKRRLTINMQTARTIGLSPRFDVLSEAELINAQVSSMGPALTLVSVAELALQQNLDLAVSRFDLELGAQDVAESRSSLLPQVSLGASRVIRREEALTRTPAFQQRTTSGVGQIDQMLYSESRISGYQQQKLIQESRVAALDAARLDSVLASTTAYLQALRSQNQLTIQQQNLGLTKNNLELARGRVRAGSASNADVFRWEASIASARSAVLAALATQQQNYDELNRIINGSIGDVPRLEMPTRDDPFGVKASDFNSLINNPRRFVWFTEFIVAQGLSQSPEIQQLDAQIDAAKRDVIEKRRAFWVPDVNLQMQYSDNFDASGLGAGTALDQVNDWSVTVNATWPLFDSGARRARLSRGQLLQRQLLARQQATSQRIEQNVRAALLSAQASYANIELSEMGADASRKNLALVSDAYRQGTVSVIDLLDAQNQSLQADLSANNAVHDFLLNIMSLQRATGVFEFLLSPDEQLSRSDALQTFIQTKEAQRLVPSEGP